MHKEEIQAIFFDVDDTLFDRKKAQIAFVCWIAGEMPHLFGDIEQHRLVEAFLESDRQFTFDGSLVGPPVDQGRDLRSRVFLRLLDLDENYSDAITSAYVRECPNMDTPIPGAKEVVEKLAAKYRLGVISNGFHDVQYRKLDTLGISHLLSCVVLPHKLGVEKPNPEIFRYASSLIGVEPKRSLNVGDSYRLDIVGAKRAGMLACWFNPSRAPRPTEEVTPDFEVQALSELLRILPCQ